MLPLAVKVQDGLVGGLEQKWVGFMKLMGQFFASEEAGYRQVGELPGLG